MNKYGTYRLMRELGARIPPPDIPKPEDPPPLPPDDADAPAEPPKDDAVPTPPPKARPKRQPVPWAYRAAINRHEAAKHSALSGKPPEAPS